MGASETRRAAREPFIPIMRALVRAYQAFARYDAAGLRSKGLTVPQADVIFSLGNTEGLSFKELGDRTLITKGTLTGVVDRLEARQLVRRQGSPQDGRSTIVMLTSRGRRVFEEVFPEQITYLKERFDRLEPGELRRAGDLLAKLAGLF